jgi:hypothetical protein
MVSTSVRSQIAPHVHLISVAIEPNMRPSAAAIKAKFFIGDHGVADDPKR